MSNLGSSIESSVGNRIGSNIGGCIGCKLMNSIGSGIDFTAEFRWKPLVYIIK